MISLVILDGFGLSKNKIGNAIYSAGTPHLQALEKEFAHTILEASGKAVGLPKNLMGNSETGHLTIGAGRKILQPMEIIEQSIKDKSFFDNRELIDVMFHVNRNKSVLHLVALLSDGGVHSHIKHLKATIDLAMLYEVETIKLHIILDGRDVPPTSGYDFVTDIYNYIQGTHCSIASISGRSFAMDRDNDFGKTKKAYNAIVLGCAKRIEENEIFDAIIKSYEKNITDEFFEPICVGKHTEFCDADGVIFCNFRKDRMRQLVQTVVCPKFTKFRIKEIHDLYVVGMSQYDDDFTNLHIAFKTEDVQNSLAEIISKNGLKQFHVAETTKFAHVTYYFNGGREEPFPNEDRKLLDTYTFLPFDKLPFMRAKEITASAIDAIASQKYDFILVNLSNCDMVGHTGNFNAAKTAVSIVDQCAFAIAEATLLVGGECIITADHGNVEEMIQKDGSPKTSHTTNPVPFILASNHKRYKLKKGELSNIAPTILDLMGLEKPYEMTATTLICR